MYAKVLIDIKTKHVNQLYDYSIPKEYKGHIKKGMRVIVPFGAQTRMGYVIDITDFSDIKTKPILDVLDVIPSITEESFDYVNHLLNTNKKLNIEAIETVLPSELFLKYEKEITLIKEDEVEESFKKLFNKDKKAKLNKEFLEYKTELNRYLKEGIVKIKTIYEQKGKPKIVQGVYYNEDHNYARFKNYMDLIEYVQENPGRTRAEITSAGFTISPIQTLIKNNVFTIKDKIVSRDVNFQDTNKIPLHILNNEQENAYQEIKKSLNKSETYLLHGITGSGKTEVYMHLIKDVLKENKTVLYLVPEITLIAPTMQYLNSRFNVEIAHYNSSLSTGERYDSWVKITNNEVDIIVGTRSSIFLPIDNLGIIIIDEEHDKSYVQTEGVQYNVIDIAKIKSQQYKIPLVLGSATPSVDSMYYSLNGKYKLLELTKRATNQKLPQIHYVDMKEELKSGNTKILSNLLFEKIKERLENKEQIILLFNRKGYAPFVMCRNCSFTPKCKHCDVSLTYYKETDELKCNYCGYKEKNYYMCPTCKTRAIKSVGVGIEYIETQIKKYFPYAKTIRMDSTTTTRKGSHEKIWLDFKDEKYDILLGTQMISKGLDFPKVTLVGILMADLSLNIPSYLASEETYSLLTQMSGRSGRKIEGEAVIQGYDLDHYSIKAVEKGYDYFYKQALYERKVLKYSPFYEVNQLLIMNDSYFLTYQTSFKIKKELENYFEVVLGPAEPYIKYVKNQFRFIITIKDKEINQEIIFEIIKKYEKEANIYYYAIPEII